MKRRISVLLAVVMALSVWANVFANESELNLTSPDDFMRVREELIQEQIKLADKSDRFIVKYKNAGVKKNAAAVVQSAFAKGKAKNEAERQQLEAKISKFDEIQKRELNMYTSSRSQSVKATTKTSMVSKKISASLTEIITLDEAVDPDDFIRSFKADMGGSIDYIQSDIKMELSTVLTEFDAGLIEANTEKLGSVDKIVAVIDTGVDVTHPTFAPRITAGYDFVNNTGNVYSPELGAEQDHGTHISGIIAGTVDNVKIMPLKVFENGSAYTSDIIAAIEYAEANGASVVNCSWGATGENPALREAMENSSMFFVCAAGNSRLDLGETPIYPAAFNLPNTISVASVNQDLGMSYFSNYGSVDIAAKGRDIISAVAGGGYRDMNGTSMSAAYVSAAAALADGDIKTALMASADKLSCLQGKVTDGNYLSINNLISGTAGQALTVTPEDDFDRWSEKTPEENWELFNASPTVQVSAGNHHVVALKSNGTVFAWGRNDGGQLGIGSTTDRYIPTQVVGLKNIKAIAAGYIHTLALGADGYVYAWGNSGYGKIANGVPGSVTTPYKITSISNIKAIAAGYNHTVVLGIDGYVYAWGSNYNGEIGNGSSGGSITTPYKITSIPNMQAIAAGVYHTVALGADGYAYAWGFNDSGQIGNGSSGVDVTTPYKITSISNIQAVATGSYHTIALDAAGYVYTWGDGWLGQIGNGSTGISSQTTPYKVTSISNIQAIGGGSFNTVALGADGCGYVWGNNGYGEIGNGSSDGYATTPYKITSISNIQTIAAGFCYTVALDTNGDVYVWGNNSYGEGGNGSAGGNVTTPTLVAGFNVHDGPNYITFSVDVDGQQVSVSGITTVGAGKEMAVTVQNAETGVVVYETQTVSGTDGIFNFHFSMPLTALSGEYVVSIVGEDVADIVEDIFEYEATVIPPLTELEYDITVNQRQVTISGTTPLGANRQVTLLVQNAETNVIAYIDQIASGTGGTFVFSFLMPENAPDGIYNVRLGGEGISIPTTDTFEYEATVTPPLTELEYSITVNERQVTISGTTPVGANKQVTLLVQNAETNTITYIDQIASSTGGVFTFSFLMPENAPGGIYNVKVGGEGISTPTTDTFEYEATVTPPTTELEYSITVNQRQVTISGTTPVGANKQVTLLVQNAQTNTIAYIDQIASGTGGTFAFSFLMPENAPDGTYNVKVGSEGISTPVADIFNYGPNDTPFHFTGDVSGAITVNSNAVTIVGQTSAGSGKQVDFALKTKVLSIPVTLYTYTVTSGANGSFTKEQQLNLSESEMGLIPSGDYTLTVSGENVQSVDYAIKIKKSTSGSFSYAVATLDSYVVIAGISGKPNANISISIGDIVSKQITTNANGSFAMGIMMPSSAESGNYAATVGVDGIAAPKTVMFAYTKPAAAPIVLEYTVTVANEAIDITGKTNTPANTKAVVSATHIATGQVVLNESATFETSGAFTLTYPIPDGMPYGEYVMSVVFDGVSEPFVESFVYEEFEVGISFRSTVDGSSLTQLQAGSVCGEVVIFGHANKSVLLLMALKKKPDSSVIDLVVVGKPSYSGEILTGNLNIPNDYYNYKIEIMVWDSFENKNLLYKTELN